MNDIFEFFQSDIKYMLVILDNRKMVPVAGKRIVVLVQPVATTSLNTCNVADTYYQHVNQHRMTIMRHI